MKSLKTKYYADKIEECGTDQKALFNVISSLHHPAQLADIFNKFFITKNISNQTKT